MPKIDLDAIPQVNRTGYPPPFDEQVAGRWQRRLGARDRADRFRRQPRRAETRRLVVAAALARRRGRVPGHARRARRCWSRMTARPCFGRVTSRPGRKAAPTAIICATTAIGDCAFRRRRRRHEHRRRLFGHRHDVHARRHATPTRTARLMMRSGRLVRAFGLILLDDPRLVLGLVDPFRDVRVRQHVLHVHAGEGRHAAPRR